MKRVRIKGRIALASAFLCAAGLAAPEAYCTEIEVTLPFNAEPVPGGETFLPDFDFNTRPQTLRLQPANALIVDQNDAVRLRAIAVLADNSYPDVTSAKDILFDASNTSVATVTPEGLILPVASGETEVSAHYRTYDSNIGVRVLLGRSITRLTPVFNWEALEESIGVEYPAEDMDIPLDDIQTNLDMIPGSTVQMEVLAALSDGTTGLLTFNRGTTYRSLNESTAKVNEFGEVYGISPGSAIIEIVHGGNSASATVTVLRADVTAPESQLGFSGKTFFDGESIFVSSWGYLAISSTDPVVSGEYTGEISVVNYSSDTALVSAVDQLSELYVGPLSLSDGVHILQFGAVDYFGNMEAIKTKTIHVDGTAPGPLADINVDDASPGGWSNTGAFNISWTDPDEVSGVAGARIKFGDVAPGANEEGAFYPAAGSLVYSSTEIVSGVNTIWLWLEDNVGNADPAMAASVELRYDGGVPVSTVSAPAYSGTGVVSVSFGANDAVSGIASAALWWRQAGADWSSGAYVLAGSSGTFSFDTHGVQGNWEFYTRACDNAGNCESVPVSTTSAKAGSYVDVTAPAISNVRMTEITCDSARVSWDTDDAASAVLEYTLPGGGTYKAYAPAFSTNQSLQLSGLVYPANYTFKITAANKTGLGAVYTDGAFYVPPKMTTNIDDQGVLNTGQPIVIEVTNPYVSSITYTLNGQTVTQVVSPNIPLQIYVNSGQGQASLSLNLDGFVYSTSFIVDTATRTVYLARFAAVDGGMDAAQGGYAALGAVGQPLSSELSGINSKVFPGHYAAIDPVAPGSIADLAAAAGSDKDQVLLSWTAPGDDAQAGTAMKYDIRWATVPITAANFLLAAKAAEVPFPAVSGSGQETRVSGLNLLTTYYFSIRAEDELGNRAGLSNEAAIFKGFVKAATVTVNGVPEVTFLAPVPPSVALISTVSATGAVAIASAAADGLTLAGNMYEIGPETTFDPPAVLTFTYSTATLAALGLWETDIAIYEHFAGEGWVKLPGQVLDTSAHKITVPVSRVASLFGVFGIIKDRAAPVTGISYLGPDHRADGKIFLAGGSSVTLSAYDPVVYGTSTGVAFTEYRIDPGTSPAFAVYSAPFNLSEGLRLIEFRSWDHAGNLEVAGSTEVYVDASAPQTAALISGTTGQEGWYVSAATVALSAVDGLSGVEGLYWLSGASTDTRKYVSPLEISSEGIHALRYYAVDNVGNREEEKAAEIKIDFYGPQISAVSTPTANAAGWNNTDVTVVFSGTDAVSGLAGCDAPKVVTEEGAAVRVSGGCEDRAGNRSLMEVALKIDKTAPVVGISSPTSGVFVATKGEIIALFSVFDALDAAPETKAELVQTEDRGSPRGTRPARVTVINGQEIEPLDIDDGLWKLAVSAMDAAGNTTYLEGVTFEVIHDVRPPRSAQTVSGGPLYETGGLVYITGKTELKLASIDDLVESGDGAGLGVRRQNLGVATGSATVRDVVFENPGPAQGGVFVSTFTLIGEPDGAYPLRYNAEDVLGNIESVRVSTVSLDNTAPESTHRFGAPHYAGAGMDYISEGTPLSFFVLDPVSGGVAAGVSLTKYRLDEGEWRIYSGSFTVPAEGMHKLEYHSFDNLMNAEQMRTAEISVDNTPPATTVAFGEPKFEMLGLPVLSPEAGISLSAADAVSAGVASGVKQIFYEARNAATGASSVNSYTRPFTLPQGTYDLRYWSTDNLGNVETYKQIRFGVAAFQKDSLQAVDGLDMSGSADISGAVRSNALVSVSGSARILGDVTASTITVSGKARITGQRISGAQPLAPEPLYLGAIPEVQHSTVPAGYVVDGRLVVSSQARLALSTGTYYFSGVELSGGSEIVVDGKVDMLVSGDVLISGGSSFNATGPASNLNILINVPSTMTFTGGGNLVARVYAPKTQMKLAGNALLGGHFFVRSALVSGNGNIVQAGEVLPEVAPESGGGKTKTSAFGVQSYGVLAGPSPEFRLGEVYVYPDPARRAEIPTFHIECGIADNVTLTIYTISGRQAHEVTLTGLPVALDDGNGLSYAYEYSWRGHIPSGIYLYSIEARHSGQKLKKTGKFGVVR